MRPTHVRLVMQSPRSRSTFKRGGTQHPTTAFSIRRGPPTKPLFDVGVFVNDELVARSTGRNKKIASTEAAQQALIRFDRSSGPQEKVDTP